MTTPKTKTENQIKAEQQKILLELQDLRNEVYKQPLTKDERINVLNRIYDSGMFTIELSMLSGQYKGTAALATIMERVSKEIDRLQGVVAKDNVLTIKWDNGDTEDD